MPSLDQIKNLPQLLSGNPTNLVTTKSGQRCLTWGCLGCGGLIILMIVGIFSGGQLEHRRREEPPVGSPLASLPGGAAGPVTAQAASCVHQRSFGKTAKDLVISLNRKRSVYEAGASKYGLAWDVLAALHYRESGLNTDHDNPFQVKGYSGGFSNRAAEVAASAFVNLAKDVYGINVAQNPTEQNLKLAFLAYNRGAMYQKAGLGPTDSPYVINYIDDDHQAMSWPDSPIAEPESTRGKVNLVPGAFTFLKLLRDCTGSAYASAPAPPIPIDKGVCQFCSQKPLNIYAEMNKNYGPPRVIILHYLGLAGNKPLTIQGAWDYFEQINQNGDETDNKYVQFVIARDGTIYQFLAETKQAAGALGYNTALGGITISIENEGHFEAGRPEFNYTPAQLSSNVRLVKNLLAKYKMPKDQVISHKEADLRQGITGRRSDPGEEFMRKVLTQL